MKKTIDLLACAKLMFTVFGSDYQHTSTWAIEFFSRRTTNSNIYQQKVDDSMELHEYWPNPNKQLLGLDIGLARELHQA